MASMLFLCFIICFSVSFARNPFPDRTDNNFLNECLSATNRHRARHHAPALHMDQGAVNYAKSRCNRVSRSEGLSHGHAGLHGFGENLYWGGNSVNSLASCKSAIDAWYNEVKHYNYNNPVFSGSTGHFTALVWKSTTRVGCARCGGRGGRWYETYVVCNYSPPGNFVGRFRENVLRP